jgi:ATP/maltotriose-dependent transcriptional regulator MalT
VIAHTKRLSRIAAAVHATQPGRAESRRGPIEPLTQAELRVLKLLPTSSYLQIANTLYVSHNTIKTHMRSVYQKLEVASRSEAIKRAIDPRLL